MPPGKDRDAAATPNWSNPVFSLTTSAAVHATLNDESLLDTFFERLHQICTLIEAQAHSANTELARDMIDKRRVQILFYGRSGAGKTTLIGTLTDQKEKLHAFGEASVTREVTNHHTPCGIHFTDRPGIDIPGAQAQTAEGRASLESMSASSSLLKQAADFLAEQARRVEWARQLADLDRRLRSSTAEDRPIALVYVQHANARLYAERVKELVARPHGMLVPTFIAIADKWSVSRAELATKEAEVDNLIAEVGANKRGKTIGRCSLSSKPKQVGGTVHPEAGVPEFVSRLLSTLDPVDALTFLRQDGLLSRAFGASRKRRRPEPEQE